MTAPAATLVSELGSICGDLAVRTGDAVHDLHPGQHPHNLRAGVVVAPGSAEEVAAVLVACAAHDVAVVTHGGRTGLVGGGISSPGDVVLSTHRLTDVEIDPVGRVAVVGAGCTLQALQDAAAAHGLEPGIDLAARGSATIGGMVSTNAGGVMAFRNGVMRHRVLGLEAVLPDGRIYRDLTKVVKHSAGYDLKHLFIGAEGTLGVVTRVVLKLDPLPPATATAMLALPSVAAALDAIRLALDSDRGHLRAAEAMWRHYLELTAAGLEWRGAGMDLTQPVYLLLLLGGADDDALQASLGDIFEQTAARHPGTSGIVAASARQAAELWRLREDTDLIYRAHADAPSYDVSVPVSQIAAYAEEVVSGLRALQPAYEPYVFGHIADGNLHISLDCPGPLPADRAAEVEAVLYGPLPALGGSFSAEHGVGSKRIHSMVATADPTKVALMHEVKHLLDAAGRLNPGKVVPAP